MVTTPNPAQCKPYVVWSTQGHANVFAGMEGAIPQPQVVIQHSGLHRTIWGACFEKD